VVVVFELFFCQLLIEVLGSGVGCVCSWVDEVLSFFPSLLRFSPFANSVALDSIYHCNLRHLSLCVDQ
jgi:hypothetical protein